MHARAHPHAILARVYFLALEPQVFFTQSVSAVSPLPNCFLCTVFKGRVRQDAQAPPLQPHPAPPPDIQMYILHICTTLSLPKVLGSDEDGQETDRQKNNLFRFVEVPHG